MRPVDTKKNRSMSSLRNLLEVRVGRLTSSGRTKEQRKEDLVECRELIETALEQHFEE